MAQRAQLTGAGRLIICLSLRYGSSVLSHIYSFRVRMLFPYLYVFPSFSSQGKSQLPLYMLIQLLHEESRLTTMQTNYADSSDEPTGSFKQSSSACGINMRTVIGQRSSCCEPAPNSTGREISSNPIVERSCNLLVRSNTKTAPVGATQSIKVMTNESSLYFTVWPHYFLFPVALAPTHI